MRPGLRDELISEVLEASVSALEATRVVREDLDPAEAADRVSRFVERALVRVLEGVPADERPGRQVEIANQLLGAMSSEERLKLPPQLLIGIHGASGGALSGGVEFPPRPQIPLSSSDLLVNGAGQPSIGAS